MTDRNKELFDYQQRMAAARAWSLGATAGYVGYGSQPTTGYGGAVAGGSDPGGSLSRRHQEYYSSLQYMSQIHDQYKSQLHDQYGTAARPKASSSYGLPPGHPMHFPTSSEYSRPLPAHGPLPAHLGTNSSPSVPVHVRSSPYQQTTNYHAQNSGPYSSCASRQGSPAAHLPPSGAGGQAVARQQKMGYGVHDKLGYGNLGVEKSYGGGVLGDETAGYATPLNYIKSRDGGVVSRQKVGAGGLPNGGSDPKISDPSRSTSYNRAVRAGPFEQNATKEYYDGGSSYSAGKTSTPFHCSGQVGSDSGNVGKGTTAPEGTYSASSYDNVAAQILSTFGSRPHLLMEMANYQHQQQQQQQQQMTSGGTGGSSSKYVPPATTNANFKTFAHVSERAEAPELRAGRPLSPECRDVARLGGAKFDTGEPRVDATCWPSSTHQKLPLTNLPDKSKSTTSLQNFQSQSGNLSFSSESPKYFGGDKASYKSSPYMTESGSIYEQAKYHEKANSHSVSKFEVQNFCKDSLKSYQPDISNQHLMNYDNLYSKTKASNDRSVISDEDELKSLSNTFAKERADTEGSSSKLSSDELASNSMDGSSKLEAIVSSLSQIDASKTNKKYDDDGKQIISINENVAAEKMRDLESGLSDCLSDKCGNEGVEENPMLDIQNEKKPQLELDVTKVLGQSVGKVVGEPVPKGGGGDCEMPIELREKTEVELLVGKNRSVASENVVNYDCSPKPLEEQGALQIDLKEDAYLQKEEEFSKDLEDNNISSDKAHSDTEEKSAEVSTPDCTSGSEVLAPEKGEDFDMDTKVKHVNDKLEDMQCNVSLEKDDEQGDGLEIVCPSPDDDDEELSPKVGELPSLASSKVEISQMSNVANDAVLLPKITSTNSDSQVKKQDELIVKCSQSVEENQKRDEPAPSELHASSPVVAKDPNKVTPLKAETVIKPMTENSDVLKHLHKVQNNDSCEPARFTKPLESKTDVAAVPQASGSGESTIVSFSMTNQKPKQIEVVKRSDIEYSFKQKQKPEKKERVQQHTVVNLSLSRPPIKQTKINLKLDNTEKVLQDSLEKKNSTSQKGGGSDSNLSEGKLPLGRPVIHMQANMAGIFPGNHSKNTPIVLDPKKLDMMQKGRLSEDEEGPVNPVEIQSRLGNTTITPVSNDKNDASTPAATQEKLKEAALTIEPLKSKPATTTTTTEEVRLAETIFPAIHATPLSYAYPNVQWTSDSSITYGSNGSVTCAEENGRPTTSKPRIFKNSKHEEKSTEGTGLLGKSMSRINRNLKSKDSVATQSQGDRAKFSSSRDFDKFGKARVGSGLDASSLKRKLAEGELPYSSVGSNFAKRIKFANNLPNFSARNKLSMRSAKKEPAVTSESKDPYDFDFDDEKPEFYNGLKAKREKNVPVYKFKNVLLSRNEGDVDETAPSPPMTPMTFDKSEKAWNETCDQFLDDLQKKPIVSKRSTVGESQPIEKVTMTEISHLPNDPKSDIEEKPPEQEKVVPTLTKEENSQDPAFNKDSGDLNKLHKEPVIKTFNKEPAEFSKKKKGKLWALPFVPPIPQKSNKANKIITPLEQTKPYTASSDDGENSNSKRSVTDVWRMAFGAEVKTNKRPAPATTEENQSKKPKFEEEKIEVKVEVKTQPTVIPVKKFQPRPTFGGLMYFFPDWEREVKRFKVKNRIPIKLQYTIKPKILSGPCVALSDGGNFGGETVSPVFSGSKTLPGKSDRAKGQTESSSAILGADGGFLVPKEEDADAGTPVPSIVDQILLNRKLRQRMGGSTVLPLNTSYLFNMRKKFHGGHSTPTHHDNLALLPTPGLPLLTEDAKEAVLVNAGGFGNFRRQTLHRYMDMMGEFGDLKAKMLDWHPEVYESKTRRQSNKLKAFTSVKEIFGADIPEKFLSDKVKENHVQQRKSPTKKIVVPKPKLETGNEDIIVNKIVEESMEKTRSDVALEKSEKIVQDETMEEETYTLDDVILQNALNFLCNNLLMDNPNWEKKVVFQNMFHTEPEPGPAVPKSRKSKGKKRKPRSGMDYSNTKKKMAGTRTPREGSSRAGTPTGDFEDRTVFQVRETAHGIENVQAEAKGWVIDKGAGETILHRASKMGYPDVVAYATDLLKMNPSTKDNAGLTPLHKAAFKGHGDVVRILLRYGAGPNVNVKGTRPLHDAIEGGSLQAVHELLRYGADLLLYDYSGNMPLDLSEGDPEMRFYLGNLLADLHCKKGERWSVSHDVDFATPDANLAPPLPRSPPSSFAFELSPATLPPHYQFPNGDHSYVLLADLKHHLKQWGNDKIDISMNADVILMDRTEFIKSSHNTLLGRHVTACSAKNLHRQTVQLVKVDKFVQKLLNIDTFNISL